MLVDTINKVKAISFDSSNLDAYVTSLRGLSATQAEVALSSAGLDKAQKQQILNKLAETNATISLTSAEATEALTRKLGSQDAAKELLIKSGLVTKEQLLAGATIEVTAAELEKAVVSGIITAQEKEQIVTALGLTGANIGLGTSFKLLATSIWASVKAMAAWLFTTPAGWATLAIGAIVGATAAYIKWGDTLENTREKLADLKSECDTITSNIESVNGEIETTKQRIAELENTGALTFTEKEELDNLVKQNNELQRTIDLLKLKQNENQKEKNKTFVSAMEKDVEQYDEYHVSSRSGKVEKGHGGRDIGIGTTEKAYIKQQLKDYQENLRQISELNEQYKDDLSDKEYQKEKKRLEDKNKKIAEYIKDKNDEFATDAEGIDYIQNPTTEDDKRVNEWLDYINDFQDKMAVAMGGENAKENAFNRLVDNWKFDELLDPIQKLGKEGKVTLDVLKSKMSDPVFAEFVNKLVEIGVISDTTDGSLRYLANAFNGTATSARNYVTSLKGNELNNFIKNLGEEAKALGTTESELAKLTAAHVIFNNTGLSTEQQQRALQDLATKIAATSSEMKYLLRLFNIASMDGVDELVAQGRTRREALRQQASVRKYLKDKYGIDLSPIEIPEKEDVNPYTPSGDDDKGKDNTPDYEDPTEAIINRINLRANELEQQEEYIQNALEIAEIENDYEKQISLTNDLIAKRKDKLAELETANAGLHNEAEWLRNSTPQWNEEEWFDSQGNATKSYIDFINGRIKAGADKEEIDAIKDQFEAISKYKKAYMDNAEEITGINKQILQDEEKIWDLRREEFDNRLEESEYYIQHSKDFGWENGDNEIKARKRVLDWIQSDYYKSLIKDDEEYYKILEEHRLNYLEAQRDEFEKATDFASSYLDSRKTLLQSYYDVTNSIAEAQHEINKELETSKTMYEWLDEDTRKLLFNQEDYNTLSKELIDIQSEADRLQRQYEYDLRNSTLETVESITSQYQMQYETLMKSYEIAKADLDIAKKKQKLNNILNERNVRMRIDGQWQWVANTEDVANAKAELADAEYAKRVAESGLTQQNSINELTKRQDELGVVIKKFEGGVIDLGEAVTLAKNAIGSLPYALSSMYSNVGSLSSANSSSSGNYKNTKSYNGTSYDPNVDYSAEMKNYEKGSAKWNLLNKRRNAKIAGEGLSYDPFASGTRCTPSGNVLIGEKEPEIFIDNNGHFIPINQPTFANIGAGGVVFNQNQLSNLRSLWDLSNIGTMPTHNISNITSRQISETNTYQMYGNMVFDGNNPEEVFKQFCDFMKHNRYKSK